MKVNAEMIEKPAQVRLLELDRVATPEEIIEHGVELFISAPSD